MAKSKTLDQVEAMRQKAVRFLEDVVGDPDHAEEFDNMSTEEYAEHKKIKIANPCRRQSQIHQGETPMPSPTRAELEERIEELEEENQALTDKLESILEIAEDDDSDEDDDSEDDDQD